MGPALACFLEGVEDRSAHSTGQGAGAQTVMRQEGLSLRLGQTLLPLFPGAPKCLIRDIGFSGD